MEITPGISLSPLLPEDLDKLIVFFRKAYGENTVFQNEGFLNYYFSSWNPKKGDGVVNLVAYDLESGDIVSHYGGLFYNLNLNNTIVPYVWGVNAYTLPEWRGKGINSKIVEYIHNNNIANAVVGMPFDAPFFYQKLGYNIFNKETFARFIYALDAQVFSIIETMQQNIERAKQIIKINTDATFLFDSQKIIKITKENIDSYILDFDITNITTTHRDHDFIKWRLLENPYIDYEIYACIIADKIKSYLVIRVENLKPQNLKVIRVIDLFGNHNHILDLLNYCKHHAVQNNYIYIDFSVYGMLYETELLSSGFTKLERDDYSLIPQVTSPIENRPNHEFLGIQSKLYADKIAQLTNETVYFTRIDSDRDRVSHISQVSRIQGE
jgi:GNAT superfamily N-acetyltransferase